MQYCAGFLIAKDQVLLIKKNRPAWQAGYWNAPGGKIEAGETPLQAMQREMREEASIDLPPARWKKTVELSFEGGVVHFFISYLSAEEQRLIRQETDEILEWHSINSLPKKCVNNTSKILKKSLDEDKINLY